MEHSREDMDDPTGARVNHGDRVIADALAWKMMKEFYRPQREQEKFRIPLYSLAHFRQMSQNAGGDPWGE